MSIQAFEDVELEKLNYEDEVKTSDLDVKILLQLIIRELKIMNTHLSVLSDIDQDDQEISSEV